MDDDRRDTLICSLRRTEYYNWEEMRPLLNGLVVNIIAVWRHGADPLILSTIRSQQRSRWGELVNLLRKGAKDFAQAGVIQPCGPPPAAPSTCDALDAGSR
jgi:hypothetical protein